MSQKIRKWVVIIKSFIRVIHTSVFFIVVLTSTNIFAADAHSTANSEESENQFELGFGVMSNTEQKDYLSSVYSDAEFSGGSAMINFEIGYSVKIGNHFSIVPKLSYAFVRVETATMLDGVTNESYNTLFMPGAALRYNFSNHGSGFYVGGQLAANNPSISDKLSRVTSIESDGNITGLFIGYMYNKFQFEFGVNKIPVVIEAESTPSTQADFGGGYFMFRRSF